MAVRIEIDVIVLVGELKPPRQHPDGTTEPHLPYLPCRDCGGSIMLGQVIPWALLVATLTAAGCSVQQHGSNDNKDVKIETPLGDMKIKTNNAVAVSDVGLPVYPGSTIVKQDKNHGAVDLELSFHDLHIRAKGVTFRTPDSPEKVKAYYRKELAQYGDVIECRGKQAVGQPSKTSQGLSCDDNGKFSASDATTHADLALKAGSKMHQHIIALEKNSEGTKFGLVAIDLPNLEKESN
jgi:hypothetical protein